MDGIAPQIALLRQMYMGLDKKSRKAFQGHWLPTLAWAKYLKNDYDITYMGIADCEEIVTKYNSKNATNFGYEKIFYCQEDAKDCSIYPLGEAYKNG